MNGNILFCFTGFLWPHHEAFRNGGMMVMMMSAMMMMVTTTTTMMMKWKSGVSDDANYDDIML